MSYQTSEKYNTFEKTIFKNDQQLKDLRKKPMLIRYYDILLQNSPSNVFITLTSKYFQLG